MQSKGVVKFFLIFIVIVTAVQYMYIFPTQRVERNAEEYATSLAGEDQASVKALRAEYLDSMSSEVIFELPYLKKFTYQDLKSRQLALGLDLKGGMSVVLQVDLKEFIQALSNDNTDPTFTGALEAAQKRLASEQTNFVGLFAEEFDRISGGNKKLADIFTSNEALRDQINLGTSNANVVQIIREKADETVDLTFKLLKERIDKLGVTQPNVSLDKERDLIIVELPGIDNPERARTFLQATAKLEFWDVYRMSDNGIIPAFVAANDKLKSIVGNEEFEIETPEYRLDTIYAIDSLGNEDKSQFTVDTVSLADNLANNQGPLFDIFQLNQTGAFGTAVMGSADKNKRGIISEYLSRNDIKSLFPADLKFRWSKDKIEPFGDDEVAEEGERYTLYALRMAKGKKGPSLTGEHVTDARPGQNPQNNEIDVSLKMDNFGTKEWGRMTTKAAQDNNREIAIVLDDEVVSAPRVINPILGGSSSISGNYTIQSAQDLSNILQVGKLPARTEIIQESLVGPSLGQDNIDKSMKALLVGFGLVILFMIFYYSGGGVISIITLILNLFIIFGALASYGTVLTLPGIAGIVLTIGMAVDANVIIYERIREELRIGKSTLAAIRDGFQHSYSAIIDANVTTILTALVLAYFGLGPIKGFAVVLIIGVLSSLFTAVLVGKLLIDWWTGKERDLAFWTGASKNVLANAKIDWMSMRKIGYVVSGILLTISIGSFIFRGFDLGVDFKGGYSYNIQFDQDVEAEALRDALTASFGETPVVKAVDTENTFNVTTSAHVDDTSEEAADRVLEKLFKGANEVAGGALVLNDFKKADGTGTHIISSSKVGPTIADDITNSSYKSAAFALFFIFLYLFIRFRKWEFSMGAVLALFHDVIITLGMFSIFYGILPFTMEIDQAFVAAILTVIGYSVNDTVIVFDRIREFINTYTGKSKEHIFNMAINSTLSRTLITSGTTLFVVLTLFLFGGGSIKGFAFALLIGVLVGTYSSIFIASSSVVDMVKDIKMKKVDTKKDKKTFTKSNV